MYPSSLATPKIARIHPPNLATPRIEPCATYQEAWASKYVKKYTCNISTFLWRAEIRRSYPKRDLSFCTSIRGYSFVGPCLQSWFRGTLQNKLKEREKDHTDGQNMWYDRTHHTPQLHTHTHKYKHTYIYSFIVMGGEVVRYGNREESQPRTVGLPYAVVDFGISSPLDAGFWIVFPSHLYPERIA